MKDLHPIGFCQICLRKPCRQHRDCTIYHQGVRIAELEKRASDADSDIARMNWLESRSFVRLASANGDVATLRRATLRESIDVIQKEEGESE